MITLVTILVASAALAGERTAARSADFMSWLALTLIVASGPLFSLFTSMFVSFDPWGIAIPIAVGLAAVYLIRTGSDRGNRTRAATGTFLWIFIGYYAGILAGAI